MRAVNVTLDPHSHRVPCPGPAPKPFTSLPTAAASSASHCSPRTTFPRFFSHQLDRPWNTSH